MICIVDFDYRLSLLSLIVDVLLLMLIVEFGESNNNKLFWEADNLEPRENAKNAKHKL